MATGASLFTADIKWPPPTSVTVAFVGLAVSAIGLVFLVMTRSDDDNLQEATQAISLAESNFHATQLAEQEKLYFAYSAKQFRSLYLAYASARSMLERAVADGQLDEEKLIGDVLLAMRLELRIALGFETDHTWTICVYKSKMDDNDGYRYLHCVAHDRSIECDITKARRWKEGIGVGGMAFAKNDEVVAPDILEAAAISLFSLNGDTLRDDDRKRYRSMFAVPVQVGLNQRPWGVVLATCNDAGHFASDIGDEEDDVALNNKEAVRALAGLVALACIVSTTGKPLTINENVEKEDKNGGKESVGDSA